ncbi:MICOS complex subunit MIC13-like [Carcharodon carcharias]|uniref:MICOS complex subunit MIC13-like n=1 Tax=Carcharodon carcharias TaxID=13397 RepID=UPI001B7EC8AF|nr:MICOS complex subunit MIC13-like [Carcharodon carcharias]
MASVFRTVRFFTKAGIIGGTVYFVYDQDLLGNGEQICEILKKGSTVLPVAVDQWTKYFGVELPDVPKLNVPIAEYWNTGVEATANFLSAAPTKCNEYTQKGWQYIKNMTDRAQ